MEGRIDKNQNQQLLGEILGLVVVAMIILVVEAKTPIQEFFLGVLVGMWAVAVLAVLGWAVKTYVLKRR